MHKKLLKEKYKDEKVFAVPFSEMYFINDKFTPCLHSAKIWSMFDSKGSYIYRYDAEGHPSMQQIIPYILIINKETNKIFTTKRIAGDSRLQDKLSMAVGGHIDQSDGNNEVLFKAAVRELFEEVSIECSEPFKIIGYVRDLNSSTSDHTGVVIQAFTNQDVKVIEEDTLQGEWMDLEQIINNYENLEGWSKYILDHFVTNKSLF